MSEPHDSAPDLAARLGQLFMKWGSDKHTHLYHEFYATLPAPKRMLEVGVFKGASLRAWREWWPEADIVGIDNFSRGYPSGFPPLTNPCLVDGDSRTYDVSRLYDGPGPDLIIDDGSHKPRDQAATFRNLWPLLAPGGVYAIEDVVLHDRPLTAWFRDRAEDFCQEWLNDLVAAVAVVAAEGAKVVIHDYRDRSGKPDSVLLVIRKS